MGYSLRGHKELDTTERLNTHTHTHTLRLNSRFLGAKRPVGWIE